MRSSSIKTALVVLTVTVSLTAAAPTAAAASRNTSRTHASATDRFQRVVNQLLNRVFGITSNALPTDPIPVGAQFGDTETATTTTRNSPKSQR